MGNIFLSETIQSYAKYPNSRGHGEYIFHNGYWAMDIEPATFYKASDEIKSSHILENEFIPNTQYVFDMWIDTDAVISGGSNVVGGLGVYYSDGSVDYTLRPLGNSSSPLGYQHCMFISPSDKSVSYVTSYYYTSTYVYFRADSYICPLDEIELHQTGVLNTQNITESLTGAKDFEIIQGNISPTEIIEL